MAKGKESVSLNPETFAGGSGLPDDFDGVIISALFKMYDYNGKSPKASPCLCLVFESEDIEEDSYEEYFSMGSADNWEPSDDGKKLFKIGNSSVINPNCNGGVLLKSLMDKGYPADKFGDDVSEALGGLKAHFIRVPAPERKGMKKKEKKYEDTILVVSDIITLPWEEDKAKGKAKASGGGTKGKSTAGKGKAADKSKSEDTGGDGDLNNRFQEYILGILAEHGSVTKKDLPRLLFAVAAQDTDKNKLVKMTFDDAAMSSGPWTFENDTLSLG